jgi:hypothetical protein
MGGFRKLINTKSVSEDTTRGWVQPSPCDSFVEIKISHETSPQTLAKMSICWVALHVCRKSPLRRVHCQLVQRLNFETLRVLSIEMPNRDT